MKVRDIMSWNVVTVSSDTPIMEARKIMIAHNVRRLPVVDKGKIVGMVSRERIARSGPSPATSLSVWEINYLLAKMTVKEIMQKDLTMVSPDTTVESAVALAQSKGVGALPVMEDHNLVGIVTTNDFFYKILNPVLGIGKPGTRLLINKCCAPKHIQEIMEVVGKQNVKIIALHNMPPLEGEEAELLLHIDASDASQIVKELRAKGYAVEVRER